ncbi:MAG: hypothetical protein M1833_000141 [Piccolia ochrophora]|nr:MAG: hypothetical protein M1833_000141 [Piccolia ochrophora]
MASANNSSPFYSPKHASTPGAFAEETTVDGESSTSTHHSLFKAVRARRDEYTVPHHIRIKVGSWNVASLKGTEKDVGAWFVQGKGVSEPLAGLSPSSDRSSISSPQSPSSKRHRTRQSVDEQERDYERKRYTLPKDDYGVLPGGADIGIYALGLQEVVDIGSPSEALRPYSDPAISQKWKMAMEDALPSGYKLVAEQQLVGLLLLIYASPNIASTISSVSTVAVGTGLMGYMGNKGAVSARLLLGETTRLVFVNSHLAAGTDKASLERRNWDAAQIVHRTKFDPVNYGSGVTEEFSEGIGDEDVAWWFGDLNYRIEGLPADDVRRLLMLHTRKQYNRGPKDESKIGNELSSADGPIVLKDNEEYQKSPLQVNTTMDSDSEITNMADQASIGSANGIAQEDPASLQTTLSSLLPHDQLHQQQAAKKAFHDGWHEGTLRFLPTYKYDVGSVGMFDSGEKKRGPSWCDRILYRTRGDRLRYHKAAKEEEEARKKDAEMKSRGMEDAGNDDDLLFEYDPETDGADQDDQAQERDDSPTAGQEYPSNPESASEDQVKLVCYTSHQRVLSSDHKPLEAVFMLSYDSVVPSMKAKVQQEVARELDRAENEGRPTITVVVDHQQEDPPNSDRARDIVNDGSNANGIDFGEVSYMQRKSRTVTVANTGQVLSKFEFADRPDGSFSPQWLSVRFESPDRDDTNLKPSASQQQTLEPGDAVNIILDLEVDEMKLVRALNGDDKTLDDVLVLRVVDGRDHFIPVKARWLPSCFGRSVDELTRFPEDGARALADQSTQKLNSDVKWSAPREIFRLTEPIDDLVERVMAEWDMTSTTKENKPPWETHPEWPFGADSWSTLHDPDSIPPLRLALLTALDTNTPLFSHLPPETPALTRLELLASILLYFLASLSDGIIPSPLWNHVKTVLPSAEATKDEEEDKRTAVLDALATASPPHNIAFVFLTSMLSRVINEIVPLPSRQSESGEVASPAAKSARTRAKSLSHDPVLAKRQRTQRAYARVFADVVIRADLPAKDKEKKAEAERREGVVALFLGGMG